MSATHDTHNWDDTMPPNHDLERRKRESHERAMTMEAEAERIENLRRYREYRRQQRDS